MEALIEGSIAYGLSAALRGEITIAGGRVQQSDFHDYLMLPFDEMPSIEVQLVPSAEAPSGVSELGTAPIAAAVRTPSPPRRAGVSGPCRSPGTVSGWSP